MSTQESHSIAERAYLIWEQMGHPEGQALEHWLRAEAEVALTAPPQGLNSEPPTPRRAQRKKA